MALKATPTYSVTPSSVKKQLQSNYISVFDYSDENLPDTYDELVSIYGKQSVSGMLKMIGAESGMSSDQSIWTEEGRLHTVYTDVARAGSVFTKAGHVFRVGETVMISDGAGYSRGSISAVDANTFTVDAYKAAGFAALATTDLTVFVDGSEFGKGTNGMEGSLKSQFTVLKNKPIILKDKFAENGSDMTNVGWVKTPEGGFLWFLKSEQDTRRRWEDRSELSMVNGEQAEAGSDAEAANKKGTEGLFEAVRKRGNAFEGVATTLADIDDIIKRFDAQGKIADYTFYCDRDQSLSIDNLLGTLNAGYDGGVSYGIFNNSKDMAVNLGFKGLTRGTYNIFKTDWKVLNDPTLLGSVAPSAGKVRGILIPLGSKEVYQGEFNGQGMGQKEATPFLQCKYKVAGQENRKYKTWVTGSVGGVTTDDSDTMNVHHLSEKCLNTVGANNFMIFEGA